jgi:hypothetical protein
MSTPTLVPLPGLDGTGDFFRPLVKTLGNSIPTQVARYPVDGCYDYGTCVRVPILFGSETRSVGSAFRE